MKCQTALSGVQFGYPEHAGSGPRLVATTEMSRCVPLFWLSATEGSDLPEPATPREASTAPARAPPAPNRILFLPIVESLPSPAGSRTSCLLLGEEGKH